MSQRINNVYNNIATECMHLHTQLRKALSIFAILLPFQNALGS